MRFGLALLLCLLAAGPAGAETLVASLSTSQVRITSNYTGSQIVVFGAIERDAQTVARAGPYQVVVTVRGPRQAVTVREKSRTGPVWINGPQQKFVQIPAYLGVFASAPIADIATPGQRGRLRIGLQASVNAPDITMDRGTEDDRFREALARLKIKELLFIEDERGTTFLTPSLFRTPVPLPVTAPPGDYEVDVTLFADGVLLARAGTSFEVIKTGFEQRLAEFSTEWAALYGLGTAAVALLFGWLATVIFRRD
ncbi:TIGR02186 family protein [Salinarimonas soli]|uniref:TIGR02186 family protein n=1 Tax=Salinarimonas soli TaxID=1638099 RepID=A0A5B2VTS2_9HYPH|nr:TIGR02186 family protein [Salinarimonas soli]KAA2242060.1 hypothetical protein F0L46_03600 [Salinarimonas soli]